MREITLSIGSGDWLLRESAAGVSCSQDAEGKRRDDMGPTGPRSAQEVFCSFSDRFGWDFHIEADILLNWFGEAMIDPLLKHIQETGQTDDFEYFLIDNFGVEPPLMAVADNAAGATAERATDAA